MDPDFVSQSKPRQKDESGNTGLPPPLLAATATVFGCCRHRSLPPPPSAAASSNLSRRHYHTLPTPPSIVANHCRCRRYRYRRWSLPLPPLTATSVEYCLRQPPLPQPLAAPAVTADFSLRRPLPPPPAMVKLGTLWPPRSLAEDMRNGEIPSEIAAILAAHSCTVCKDRMALTPEKSSGRGIHSFLAQPALGVDPVPGLDRVTAKQVG